MDNRTSELLDRTRPLQTMVGMAPGSFFGSTNEDVDIFLDECDKARRYNQWENGDVVVRLAYFLEGNARYAFEAEVADRVAKHRRAVNRATNGDDDDQSGENSNYYYSGRTPAAFEGKGVGVAEAKGDETTGRGKPSDGVTLSGLPGSAVEHPAPESTTVQAWARVLAKTRESLAILVSQLSGHEAQAHAEMILVQKSASTLSEIEKTLNEPGAVDADEAILRALEGRREDAQAQREASFQRLTEVQAHADAVRPSVATLRAEELELVQTLATATAESAHAEYQRQKVAREAARVRSEEPRITEMAEDDTVIAFPTFDEFSSWLRAMFQREDVTHAFMSEFYGRRQLESERVQDFAYAILRLSKRSGMNLTERERSKHFLDGLAPRMKKHIRREWEADQISDSGKWNWNALLRTARRLEKEIPVLSYGAAVTGRNTSGVSMNGRHSMVGSVATYEGAENYQEPTGAAMSVRQMPKSAMRAKPEAAGPPMAELMGMMKQLMETCTTAKPAACGLCGLVGHDAASCSSRVRGALRCYNCGEVGHLSRSCPQPATPATLNARAASAATRNQTIKCYSCQQMGHYANACPNRAAATDATAAAPASGMRVCYNCNQPGHFARECTEGQQQPAENGGRTQA